MVDWWLLCGCYMVCYLVAMWWLSGCSVIAKWFLGCFYVVDIRIYVVAMWLLFG